MHLKNLGIVTPHLTELKNTSMFGNNAKVKYRNEVVLFLKISICNIFYWKGHYNGGHFLSKPSSFFWLCAPVLCAVRIVGDLTIIHSC